MLSFHHIQSDRCPTCGCTTVVEEGVGYLAGEVYKHANGQRWEHRSFVCGARVEWSPEKKGEIVADACQANPIAQRNHQKILDAQDHLLVFLRDLDVTDRFRDQLIKALNSLVSSGHT